MKLNLRNLLMASFALTMGFSYAQSSQDFDPNANTNPRDNSNDRALFDVQYQHDVGVNGSTGVQSLAGVALFNNQFWVSQWNSARIYVLNFDGSLAMDTTIAGITGTRSITTDGTSLYFGTASTVIYKVNPTTMTTTQTINISTVSNAEARMCTYDATLDNGNGGFWIGDFSSDIASVNMSGTELSVIPSATHGLAIYGGAFDNYSPGGPFLWVFDQSGTNQTNIVQVNPSTGVPTGVTYDYLPDALSTTTSSLAGGLFISNESVTGTTSFIGLAQATPSNELFSLELTSTASVNSTQNLALEIYPNPAQNQVTINTGVQGNKDVVVYDITGKKVMAANMKSNKLDVNTLNAGIYIIEVTQNGNSNTQKLIIK